jgi:hypothetical protein
MRYVTFYHDIFRGTRDVVVHQDKPTALRYFRRHYRDYFQINGPFCPPTLPASYGYAHRRFYGMSIRAFNKYWKEPEGGKK